MSHPLAGFFSADVNVIESSLRALQTTREGIPIVSDASVPVSPDVPGRPQGLWSEPIFGPVQERNPDAWALIPLAVPVLHPDMMGAIAKRLGVREAELLAVAEERAWLEDGRVCFPPGHPGADSKLSTEIWDWPPDPGYITEDVWRRAVRPPKGLSYETWLKAWYKERGIDYDAIEALRAGPPLALIDAVGAKTGVDAIVEALIHKEGKEEAGVWAIRAWPVPPVPLRPLERRPGGMWVGGAKNDALVDILDRNGRIQRLIELEAPATFIRVERLVLQREVRAAIALFTNKPPEVPVLYEGELRCERPNLDEPVWPIPERVEDLLEVIGLAFEAPGRVWIDFPTTSFELNVETGEILRTVRSGGLRLLGVKNGLGVYTGRATWAFCVLRTSDALFLEGEMPSEIPFVFEEHLEVAWVVDVAARRQIKLKAVGDYPTNLRLSSCLRYLAANDKHGGGGVYRYDGELQFPVGVREPKELSVLGPGGIKKLSDRARWRLDERINGEGELLAFVLDEKRDGWRRFEGNAVVEGREVRFRLWEPVSAAAFDESGESLLVATRDSLVWIGGLGGENTDVQIRRHYSLKPLQAMLVGPLGRGKPKANALNAVLYKYGTLVEAAKAKVEELAVLNMASTFDEPVLLGKAQARRVLERAKMVEPVSHVMKMTE